jgi:mannose-6-phosphate isomerase-like protein (cupin superfamily)
MSAYVFFDILEIVDQKKMEGYGSVHLGGLGVVFKLFSTDTGGAFALVEHPIEPGALEAPPHLHHNEDEASYVLEGQITVQIGERVIHASPGTLVLKPKGIFHTFWNAGTKPARILEIIAPAGSRSISKRWRG